MPHIQANDIQIEYKTFGDKKNPALLLIIGLGGQLIYWQEAFCDQIAQNGYYVICFDNRESGLSTKSDDLHLGTLLETIHKVSQGQFKAPFGIEDMASDAVGLLDALGIEKAHICGMSMGGFIAQTICIRHSSRVLSLTSIYSHTGAKGQFIPQKEVLEVMLTPPSKEPELFIQEQISFFKLTYGNGKGFDEVFHRNVAQRSVDRSFSPQGRLLQYLAIITQEDRTNALEQLNIPALVIHGDADPLVPLSGGIATAKALKNSKFKILKGMGHIIPNLNVYWSDILDDMLFHIKQF